MSEILTFRLFILRSERSETFDKPTTLGVKLSDAAISTPSKIKVQLTISIQQNLFSTSSNKHPT